jgi:hypothetical protein
MSKIWQYATPAHGAGSSSWSRRQQSGTPQERRLIQFSLRVRFRDGKWIVTIGAVLDLGVVSLKQTVHPLQKLRLHRENGSMHCEAGGARHTSKRPMFGIPRTHIPPVRSETGFRKQFSTGIVVGM